MTITARAKFLLQRTLDSYDMGIQILGVKLTGVNVEATVKLTQALTMPVISTSYSQAALSFFIARLKKFLDEQLIAPLPGWIIGVAVSIMLLAVLGLFGIAAILMAGGIGIRD